MRRILVCLLVSCLAALLPDTATAATAPEGVMVPSSAEQSAGRLALPPDCQSPYEPYAYTPQALGACGLTTYPASISALPGGGLRYAYYKPDGSLFEEAMIPPPAFQPLEASAEELVEYGFPPRPSPLEPPTALSEWERNVTLRRLAPEPFAVGEIGATAGVRTDVKWSGAITNEGSFTNVEAEYLEPSFDDTQCKKSAAFTWAGFGGGPEATKTSYLFQAGTAHSNGVSVNLSNHQPWWETYSPSTEETAQPFPQSGAPATGDQLRAGVETEPGKVRFNVYDYELEVAWSTNRELKGRVASPATAEVIVERPRISKIEGGKKVSYLPELSKFGKVNFVAARAAQEEGFNRFLSVYPNSQIIMKDEKGENPLAVPTISSPEAHGGFVDEWRRCN